MIDQFVCVRLVKANGLDLTLFQFDFDLTFSVFFMNADKTIYGRYGTRSSVEAATQDISIRGLAKSMSAALKLHQGYPANRSALTGKQAASSQYKSPDDFPTLRGKYGDSLDYPGAVTKSCMHCHQIRDAERQVHRDAGQAIPDPLLFPNPHPGVIGLQLDPLHAAKISQVNDNSPAAKAGFRAGDELLTLDGQSIISTADVQWVLHHAKEADRLPARVQRMGETVMLELDLPRGWRRQSDISWRVSSWPLRRMVTGGILFEPVPEATRRNAGIADDRLALLAKHVGQYGPHAAAKKAGFKKGDVIISFDGRNENMTPSQLLAYAAQNTKAGQRVPVTVIRDGKRFNFSLPMQK